MKSKTLSDIKEILNKQRLYKSDIVNLMTQTRRLLEIEDKKKQYSILNFYCNWSVHSKLDGSSICYEILEKLSDMLIAYDNRSDMILNVNEILSIPKLKKEFIQLFQDNNLSLIPFQIKENWKNIFMLVASNLIERPIEFPELIDLNKKRYKKAKKIYDSIINKCGNKPYCVKRFYLKEINRKVYWNINTISDYINLISELKFCD
jgi:hypothetical protein